MRNNNALHIPDGFVVRGGMLCPIKRENSNYITYGKEQLYDTRRIHQSLHKRLQQRVDTWWLSRMAYTRKCPCSRRGYVDQAVMVARNFVPEGIITTVKFKDESRDTEYRSGLKEPYFKVVVLNFIN